MLTLAVLALAISAADAQRPGPRSPRHDRNYDENGFQIAEKDNVSARLRVAFPMCFGTLVPLGGDVESFPKTSFKQNFYYSLDIASIYLSSESSPWAASIGVRMTFMDFYMQNPDQSYRYDSASKKWEAYSISSVESKYDRKMSKIQSDYVGVPVRLYYNVGHAKFFAGAGADYMFSASTKYKSPKVKSEANDLFNRFKANAEVGFAYGGIGVFASYSFTPVLSRTVSDAGVLSFGLALGL